MKLGLSQSARLEQRLIQSPQMIQAMQILQLPSLDLEERIEQELMENPFLEVAQPEEAAGNEGSEEGNDSREDRELDNMIEVLERYESDFGDGGTRQRVSSDEGDRKLEAMQNTPDRHQTLAEALIDQLPMIDFTPRQRELVEYLIYSFDERGYLPEPLSEIAQLCDVEDVEEEELEQVLLLLRDAIHPSLGARDLRECLVLQVDAHDLEEPLVRMLILDHLEDIVTNRLPRIAKATGVSIEDVKEALETIRHLDPNPGGEYGEQPATIIVPDVVVEESDGQFEVRLTRQQHRELTVSSSYRRLLDEAAKGDGVREWIKKRLEGARWFIDALQQRQNTLHRIASSIFQHQESFLREGLAALKPLRMQEVADEVGVHISTVSRAVSGKYAQTSRGIFPLKFFFTSGTAKTSGEVTSQVSIKQRVKDIVEMEDPKNPLSDDQLAARLQEVDGIRIARRTITKYRKALDIPSSSQRRKF